MLEKRHLHGVSINLISLRSVPRALIDAAPTPRFTLPDPGFGAPASVRSAPVVPRPFRWLRNRRGTGSVGQSKADVDLHRSKTPPSDMRHATRLRESQRSEVKSPRSDAESSEAVFSVLDCVSAGASLSLPCVPTGAVPAQGAFRVIQMPAFSALPRVSSHRIHRGCSFPFRAGRDQRSAERSTAHLGRQTGSHRRREVGRRSSGARAERHR